MKKKNNNLLSAIKASSIGLVTLGLVSSANATLEVRLGGLAYYDTDLNITWLANANAAAGSVYDGGSDTSDGLLTWQSANLWTASLVVDGVSGWRLPNADLNNNHLFTECSLLPGDEPCNDSEMGYQYWIEHIYSSAPGPFTGFTFGSSGNDGYWNLGWEIIGSASSYITLFDQTGFSTSITDTNRSYGRAWGVVSGAIDARIMRLSRPARGHVALTCA